MERTDIPPESKLPVSDARFRYLPTKNPYYTKLAEIEDGAFLDHGAEEQRGAWRERLDVAPHTPLHVEIGCNGGHVTLGWAAQRPNEAFIGLDWKVKQVFKAYEKAEKRGIDNAVFVKGNAERLKFLFSPGEITALYSFFPDPWEREKQHKNRYLTTEWFLEHAQLLAPGGLFHLKTDHDGYFDWIVEAAKKAQSAWQLVEVNYDLHAEHPNPAQLEIPEVTLFERLFIRDGIPIKSLVLKKVPNRP